MKFFCVTVDFKLPSYTCPGNLAGKLRQLPPPLEFTNLIDYPPSGNRARTTPPPLEFTTEPHRLPPLEIGPENSVNYPPSNSRPEGKFAPPPPQIQFLDPPLVNICFSLRNRHRTFVGKALGRRPGNTYPLPPRQSALDDYSTLV